MKNLKQISTPYIIVVGRLNNPSKFYVVLRDVLFECADVLEALMSCFKACVALHSWPNSSEHIWYFLMNYVFNLESDHSIAFVQKNPVGVLTFIEKVDSYVGKSDDLY